MVAAVLAVAFPAWLWASPYVLGKNVVGDGTFSSSIASGSNGFACTTNGCRFDLGTGSDDYLTSDGTRVTVPGRFGAADAVEVPADTGTIYLNGTTRSVGLGIRSSTRVAILGVLPLSPNTDQAINLGEATVRWSNSYIVTMNAGTATATGNIAGAINASTASTTVGAVTISPSNTLDANDLVLNVEAVTAGTNIFTVDLEGDIVATGTAQATGHYSTGGDFYSLATTAPNNLASDMNAATASSTVPAVRTCSGPTLDADDLLFGVGQSGSCTTERFSVDNEGDVMATASYGLNGKMHWSATVPTVVSGGCTSPSISSGGDTASFNINIGTSCTGVTDIVIGLPTSARYWNCWATTDAPNTRVVDQVQTGSATQATFRSYSRTTGLPIDWTASQTVQASCVAGGF